MKLYLRNDLGNYVAYEIDEGSVIRNNYNESLDSANVRISHIPSELNIQPLDSVYITDDDSRIPTKYFLIDTYRSTEYGLYDVKTWSYEISLVSPTKAMEGIICPNLSITNTTSQHTILYYLELYLNLYGPKIRKTVNNVLGFNPKWHLSSEILSDARFQRICPEMQWNMPTLREIFNDLMMVVDCIPIIRRNETDNLNVANEIHFLDLTLKGKEVSNYNYITKSQSSADYISELQMQMQNVMQTNINNVRNVVSTTEYQTFTSESNVITNQNIILKTEYPILRLKKLEMYIFPVDRVNGTGETIFFKADLMNISCNANDTGGSLVWEKSAYDKKNILYRTRSLGDGAFMNYNVSDYFSQYQNYCIYYTRGSNVIDGFTQETKGQLLDPTRNTLEWLKCMLAYIYGNNRVDGADSGFLYAICNDILNRQNDYMTTLFKIEYETSTELMFKASKSENPRNKRVVVDNQTSSFVDAYNQGNLEYQKANRLGNQGIHINQRISSDYTKLIEIGDTYGDSIVYQTEYQIYQDHIEVNAQATKNYILRDYFTGIKAKIRTFSIAREEAFIRHDVDKYYIEFSKTRHLELSVLPVASVYFAEALDENRILHPLKYCALMTNSNSIYYSVNFMSRIVGKSLVFTMGFTDNYIISKHIDSSLFGFQAISSSIQESQLTYDPRYVPNNQVNEYGGFPLQYYSYTDDNGEFVGLNIYLFESINIASPSGIISSGDFDTLFNKSMDRPKISIADINDIKISSYKDIYKDNREIPRLSMQFEFCTDTRDIYVTRYFIENQVAIRESRLLTFKVYSGPSSSYEYGRETKDNEIQTSGTITLLTGFTYSTQIRVGFSQSTIIKNRAFYIVDQENHIWLGINQADYPSIMGYSFIIYMNFLKDRDKNIYDNLEKPINEI